MALDHALEVPKQGVVVVVHHDGRFLMIQRAAGILAGGAWCFVGGGIEPQETQADAVVREFHEEVGGEVKAVRKIWEYHRPDGRLVLHWWLAEWSPSPLTANPAEVAEIRWVTPSEFDDLDPVLESNRLFMREMGRGIHGPCRCCA